MEKSKPCGQKTIRDIFFIFILFLAALSGGFVYAANEETSGGNKSYTVNLDEQTAKNGYTLKFAGGSFRLVFEKGALGEATDVEITEINEEMETPWQFNRLGKIYQFDVKNKSAYGGGKPLLAELFYEKAIANYKQAFYFDKNYNFWRPLPTKDNPDKMLVLAKISLPFARLAVFEAPDVLISGKASWYSHKKGNFAASPDFPKGSKLRVYNLKNKRYVDVEINDYGPERALHPDRVVDLEKRAFAKISSLAAGVIDVRIEPLYIAPGFNETLSITDKGASADLTINSKSAVVFEESSGDVIFSQNSTSTLPLASLTKLVAVKIFLDTRPTLTKVVSYSVRDEEYNYQYVENKWESARLKVKDGDTLTVEDLIYAALVGSANNTIESLVRASGLEREDFIKKMNEATAAYGATSTYFAEPTGLSPANVSSAADYAIIIKGVFANPVIEKASRAREYKFATINTKQTHKLKNFNPLVTENRFKITGSKTGYLKEAGYCLMTRAKTPAGGNIIVVTMGAKTKAESVADVKELLKYGMKIANNK